MKTPMKTPLESLLDYCDVNVNDKTTCRQAREQFEKMKKDLLWLSCLNMAGVDNWEGCEYAQELLEHVEKNP